jgi:hypothetical protein
MTNKGTNNGKSKSNGNGNSNSKNSRRSPAWITNKKQARRETKDRKRTGLCRYILGQDALDYVRFGEIDDLVSTSGEDALCKVEGETFHLVETDRRGHG